MGDQQINQNMLELTEKMFVIIDSEGESRQKYIENAKFTNFKSKLDLLEEALYPKEQPSGGRRRRRKKSRRKSKRRRKRTKKKRR